LLTTPELKENPTGRRLLRYIFLSYKLFSKTVYNTEFFIKMTQISHRIWGLCIKIIGYTKLYSMVVVCVCVPKTKYRSNVLGHGLRKIFGLKSERVAGG